MTNAVIDNVYYANGRVSALTGKLLSQDKFTRLADCVTLQECTRLLTESGYGQSFLGASLDIIDAETKWTIEFLTQMCVDNYVVDFLLSPYDYLNIKTLLKGKALGKDVLSKCNCYGLVEAHTLLSSLEQDTDLPEHIVNTVCSAWREYEQYSHPLAIDRVVDKCMYEHLKECALATHNPIIIDYLRVRIDCKNIFNSFRCATAGLSDNQACDTFLAGGNITKERVCALYDAQSNVLVTNWTDALGAVQFEPLPIDEQLRSSYQKLMSLCVSGLAEQSLATAEKYADSYPVIRLARNKNAVDGNIPLVNYFLAKMTEIDNVRLILTLVANDVDKQIIKQKLREMYV